MKILKDYEIGSVRPEFDFIINALQHGVLLDQIQITDRGFETFINNLEHALDYEDVSIYLENGYAESEYNRGYDDGYRDACEEHEFE